MSTLSDRIAMPDLVNKTEAEIVEILNAPDPENAHTYVHTRIGAGTIMATLGSTAGAALLDTIASLSASSPVLKWALKVIDRGELDLYEQAARDQIDSLVTANILTAENGAKLKALAKGRHLSWAEVNNIEVTTRTVGIARGANPGV